MTNAFSLPDYCTRFFEYKDLDKVLGQPTIDSIARLIKHLMRNSQRVSTTLGGGQLGYLALIITQADYLLIPGSANFLCPTDPGIFAPILVGRPTRQGPAVPLTAAEVTAQKLTHDELQRQYNECQAVESALRNQIIEAIEPKYLHPLRNMITNMSNNNIPEIITFL